MLKIKIKDIKLTKENDLFTWELIITETQDNISTTNYLRAINTSPKKALKLVLYELMSFVEVLDN